MENLVVIKPKEDFFKTIGAVNTRVDEIKFFPKQKKMELKCSLKSICGFDEIDAIETNLKRKFGENIVFDFKLELMNKNLETEEICRVVNRVIKDVKLESVAARTCLSIYRYSYDEEQLIIEVKNKMALDQMNKNNIPEIISEKIKNFLGNRPDVIMEVGDFEKEINNVLNNKSAESIIPQGIVIKKDKIEIKKQGKENSENKKESNILFGKEIKANTIKIKEVDELYVGDDAVVEGEIFKLDSRDLSTGKKLVIMNITDKTDSIAVKIFLKSDEILAVKEGMIIKVKGKKQQDKFDNAEDVLFANHITKVADKQKRRMDNAERKRVELHAHTKMSDMDAVVEVKDLVKRAMDWGHQAIAITDHGVGYGYPDAYKASKDNEKFKAIMGIEGYLVDDTVKMVENPKNISIEEETYVVFDLETTGFDPYHDRIIEIGAVKLEGSKIIDRFSMFVNPERSIPKVIVELTNITDEMVKDAEKINEVLIKFLDFVGDATVIAHNANFDVGFIKQKTADIGLEFHNSVIDTLQWSRNILTELKRHNLKEVSKHFEISLDNHHRAVDDAEATAEIFKRFIGILLRENVYKLTEIDIKYKNDIKNAPTFHIIILAKNKTGLFNLYKLISKSHIDYFKKSPRIPKSVLAEMKEGLIIGSACEGGEVIQAYLRGKAKEEIEEIAKFYDYLEIQPISNNMFLLDKGAVKSEEELKDINRFVYRLGKELEKPVCATGDVHYMDKDDAIYRQILLYGQGFKDFSRDPQLYFRTTDEMLDEFSYLGDDAAFEVVVENTNAIADMVEKMNPIPKGFYPPKIEGAEEQVRTMTYKTAHELYGTILPEVIEQRLERELKAIINNGFAVLYLTAHKLVKKSLDDNYIVGSRGSVGSSLVARMMNITEVNALYPHYLCSSCFYSEFMEFEGSGVDLEDKDCPKCGKKLKKEGHSIPFEVFMGFDGDKVPDIDLNFSGEYQSHVHRYTEELFGKENVFKAGTISTLADKNAFGYVKKYVEENSFKMKKAEMERLAKGCENVRKTTGQHPGGMIVLPYDHSIYEFTPVQKPANDMKSESITTHFDYHVMDEQLVKLDILGHDDPTTIKLLSEYTGVDIYDVPLDDRDTIAIFRSTETLSVTEKQIDSPVGTFGIPEFGTPFVRQMLVETRPKTFAELVRICGLSHGTDVWLNNAQDYIKQGKAKLSQVISVRDDIMNYMIGHSIDKSTAFKIMEFVRRGKPTTDHDKWTEYAKLMKEHGVQEWYIESCKKIKYMFPKGHAVAYVMMAVRIAYFKTHYPVQFYAAYLSRKADDFNAQTMIKDVDTIKTRRKELEGLGKLDVKEKNELALLEILIEMHYRRVELLNVDLYKSDGDRFKLENGKIRAPLISIPGLGASVMVNIVEEREKTEFLSFEDLMRRTKTSKTVIEKLKECGAITGISEFNQRSLW